MSLIFINNKINKKQTKVPAFLILNSPFFKLDLLQDMENDVVY